jgi:hypothetical protein
MSNKRKVYTGNVSSMAARIDVDVYGNVSSMGAIIKGSVYGNVSGMDVEVHGDVHGNYSGTRGKVYGNVTGDYSGMDGMVKGEVKGNISGMNFDYNSLNTLQGRFQKEDDAKKRIKKEVVEEILAVVESPNNIAASPVAIMHGSSKFSFGMMQGSGTCINNINGKSSTIQCDRDKIILDGVEATQEEMNEAKKIMREQPRKTYIGIINGISHEILQEVMNRRKREVIDVPDDELLDKDFSEDPEAAWIETSDDPDVACKLCLDYIAIFSVTCKAGVSHSSALCYNCAKQQAHKQAKEANCPWCNKLIVAIARTVKN